MKKLIIFGTGDIAQIAHYYFSRETAYKIEAFTLDSGFIKEETFEGLPVLPFDKLPAVKPPASYDLFIALSYSRMNKLREEKYYQAKQAGYYLPSFISKNCTYLAQQRPGDNCFIFEDNTVQPFVKIEDNVTIWSGNHIGHHSVIRSHNFISSHVVISGHCEVQPNCFLGVNATVGHGVTLARETLLGAGTVVTKNTKEKGVYVAARPTLISKTSDQISL